MARRLRKCLASMAVLLLVAGCGTSVVQSQTGVSGGAKKRVLAFAGKQGPMLLQVSGEPFREGKGETAAVSAKILSGVYPEVPDGFTLNPAVAGAPQYRFRIAFDPPVSTSAEGVCSANGCGCPVRPDDHAGGPELPQFVASSSPRNVPGRFKRQWQSWHSRVRSGPPDKAESA